MQQLQAISAEIIKNRHSSIKWVTVIAFAIAPVMGGMFMFLIKEVGHEGLAGTLRSKAIMMSIFLDNLTVYLYTSILGALLNNPIAFFALKGKGYLPPLGW